MTTIKRDINKLKEEALAAGAEQFAAIDRTAQANTAKVLRVMQKHRVSAAHFNVSCGYAYDDLGRDTLDKVFADVLGAEKALVRTQFVSGTHAIAAALFGILRPGDEVVSVTGKPYDTLQTVLGYDHPALGSLKEFGVNYDEVPLSDGKPDLANIKNAVGAKTKLVMVQRSRGYSTRAALTCADIVDVCAAVKSANPDCAVFVDNCYGEFTEEVEPLAAGADIIAGSLIKNPGGGIAPTGGYVAGRADLTDLAAARLTCPGLGGELGASLCDNRLLYQGLFVAPHVVAGALKGAVFAAELFSRLNFETFPKPQEKRGDIIQALGLKTPERLIKFCRAVQEMSPVDSFAAPEPWDMPGYADKIIMAAGTFVQGASIELSADAPLRPPYNVYLQGGLTFEHTVIALTHAAEVLMADTAD